MPHNFLTLFSFDHSEAIFSSAKKRSAYNLGNDRLIRPRYESRTFLSVEEERSFSEEISLGATSIHVKYLHFSTDLQQCGVAGECASRRLPRGVTRGDEIKAVI